MNIFCFHFGGNIAKTYMQVRINNPPINSCTSSTEKKKKETSAPTWKTTTIYVHMCQEFCDEPFRRCVISQGGWGLTDATTTPREQTAVYVAEKTQLT